MEPREHRLVPPNEHLEVAIGIADVVIVAETQAVLFAEEYVVHLDVDANQLYAEMPEGIDRT